jgi:NAD(P)-dependent dehydrogenase (short-subunit alcohol dehydrogenase family)
MSGAPETVLRALPNLDAKVAVVTGAANGIGLKIVHQLLQEGMSVCLLDVETDTLNAALHDCMVRVRPGRRVIAKQVDVTQPEAVQAAATAIRAELGDVHLLCANAGICTPSGGAPDETPLVEWHQMLSVNLFGIVHSLQAFLPAMRATQQPAYVLLTASSSGILATANRAAYSASKHAVVGLAESLYLQLKGTQIGVSLLCPGVTATRMINPDRNRPAGALGRPLSAALLARAKPPIEVAQQAVAGIKRGQFWILTHDDLRPAVLDRARAMAAGEPPPDSYH